MKNINRIFISSVAALVVFFSLYINSPAITANIILAVVLTFVGSLFILFLDVLFKGLDSEQLVCTLFGILLGTLASYFITLALPYAMETPARPLIFVLSALFGGYAGHRFALHPGLRVFGGGAHLQDKEQSELREKILDTSVVIDGRILDIAETNFIDGPFIIPNFVLREIQLISDSPDPIKRNRGRRGLDMLNKLQQHGSVKVKISYIDYSDTREVDAKLVKLARETGAKLVTNDFNLNKVAELQGVEVLNLNNLTNALKPVVLPGEDIVIDVLKEGKDENQGIGYLEDGTMVVVENGRQLLNKTVRVNVTSIIQTAAGKMIFTRAVGPAEDTEEPVVPRMEARPESNRPPQQNGNRNGRNQGGRRDRNPQYNEDRGRRR